MNHLAKHATATTLINNWVRLLLTFQNLYVYIENETFILRKNVSRIASDEITT